MSYEEMQRSSPGAEKLLSPGERVEAMLRPRGMAQLMEMDSAFAKINSRYEPFERLQRMDRGIDRLRRQSEQINRMLAPSALEQAHRIHEQARRVLQSPGIEALQELVATRNVLVHGSPAALQALQVQSRWLRDEGPMASFAQQTAVLQAVSALERIQWLRATNQSALRFAQPDPGAMSGLRALNAALAQLSPSQLPLFSRKLAEWSAALEHGGAAGSGVVDGEIANWLLQGSAPVQKALRALFDRGLSLAALRVASVAARRKLFASAWITHAPLPRFVRRVFGALREQLASVISSNGPPALAAALGSE